MDLAMWHDLVNWLSHSTVRATIWTVVAVGLAVITYLLLRRRLRSAQPLSPVAARTRRRLLGLVVLLILLFVLVRIWTSHSLGAGGGQQSLLERVLWTIGIAAVTYILISGVQHALLRSGATIESRHRIRLATSWIGFGVFLVALAIIWLAGIRNLGVFLGILGAGLALSLQETLVCLSGWMLLVFRRPFDIGDRIEIDGRVGDVIGISVFQTTMLEVGNWVQAEQSTGRMLIIPNSMLMRHAVYNYTKGFPFVWDEFSLVVTFESDWQAARDLILQQAEVEAEKIQTEVKPQIEIMQRQYAIRYEQLTPIVYTSVADNGVRLTLRYLSPVRARRTFTDRISRNALTALLEHPRIDLAYPTTRLFRNTDEGKPDLRRDTH